MLIRPLDGNGDILPVSDINQLATGANAVAEVIDLRLNFFYGEWWEDPELGFRIPEFLVNNARGGDIELLSKYIASYISNSPEVKAVTDVQAAFNNHEMTFFCTVLTRDGKTDTVEVNINGGLL